MNIQTHVWLLSKLTNAKNLFNSKYKIFNVFYVNISGTYTKYTVYRFELVGQLYQWRDHLWHTAGASSCFNIIKGSKPHSSDLSQQTGESYCFRSNSPIKVWWVSPKCFVKFHVKPAYTVHPQSTACSWTHHMANEKIFLHMNFIYIKSMSFQYFNECIDVVAMKHAVSTYEKTELLKCML